MAVSSYPPISTGPTPPRVFGDAGRFTNLGLPAGTTSIQSSAGGRLGSTVFGPGTAVVTSTSPVNELVLHAGFQLIGTSWRSGYNSSTTRAYRHPELLQKSVCYSPTRNRAYGISNGTNNTSPDQTWQYRVNASGDADLFLGSSYGRLPIMAKTTSGSVYSTGGVTWFVNRDLDNLGGGTQTQFTNTLPSYGDNSVTDVASTQVDESYLLIGGWRSVRRGTTAATPANDLLFGAFSYPSSSNGHNFLRVCAKPGVNGYYIITGDNGLLVKTTTPTPTSTAHFGNLAHPLGTVSINNIAYNEETNTWLIISGTSAAVSSNEGATWTSVTLPFNGDLGVYHAGGYFFKVADSRNAFVSRNGISWSRLIVRSQNSIELMFPCIDAVVATRQPNGSYRFYGFGLQTWSDANGTAAWVDHATWSEFEFTPPGAIVTSHAGIELGVA